MSRSLFASYFAEKIRMSPSLGSYLGDRRRDSHYEDALSPNMLQATKELLERYKKAIEAKKALTVEDVTLAWEVKIGLADQTFPLEQLSTNSFRNTVLELSFNESQMYSHPSESRYRDYAIILRTVIYNMQQGIISHTVLPRRICERLISSIQEFVDAKLYMRGTEEAVTDLLHFLKKDYLPASRHTIGICELPHGKSMYRHLIRQQTSTNMTPEAIHAYGIKEVERLENAFRRVQAAMGRKRESLQHFYKWVMNHPDHYCKSTADVMKYYRQMQKRIRETVWKDNFDYTLKTDYHIKKVSKDMELTSAGAFYIASSYRPGGFEGTFYVNTRDLRENPIYNMYSLSIHEGFHHYQYQYMIEKKVPPYMIYGVSNNAYPEGIALYAEELGDYSDPLEEFGQLVNAMLRAARLVIDTGIHWYGWSWEKAITYMTHHVPLSSSEIQTEVERYICNPAQALCYSIGRKVFIENREKYLKAFPGDIKGYHRLLLEDGVVPLHVIVTKVHNAIHHKASI
jgi:uncharacterized protein (DUF885 family)